MADGELWHVRMSPDEVKELTLEQLDDLFRLDIIEADTLIWQPGMTEWLPLSVVAGLGDDDGEAVSIPVSAPPPPLARTHTSWPPKPVPPSRSAPPPLSQRPAPAPPSRSAPPPLSQRPAPPSQRPAPLSSRPAPPPLSQRPAPPPPSTGTSWPPPSAWSNPPPRPAAASAFASTVAEPPRSVPPSVAPVSYAPDPFAPTSAAFTTLPAIRASHGRSSSGGSWVVLLSLAAGAALTLYRNDLVHAAMHSIGQEGAYVKLETALGGPSFGTPRAVQQMAAASAALTSTPSLDAPVAASPSLPTTATAAATSTPAATATSEPAPATPPTEAKTAAPASEPPKPEAPRHDPPKATAPAPRPAARTSAPEQVDPVFKTPKKGKKGGKGSEYDPLNPSL